MKIHIERIKVPFFLFISTLIWAFIQTQSFIPKSWGHPLWPLTAQTLEIELPSRISLVPEQTLTALMRLISYGLVFILASYYCQKSDNAEKLFNCLAISGFIYSIYGLIIYLGDFNKILWFDKWAYSNDITSTFVNRNNFATYAGLTLLCIIPTLLRQLKSSSVYGLGSKYDKQLLIETMITRASVPLLMFIVTGSALFLTHSRGGFLSTTLAITVLFITLSLSKKIRNQSLSIALIAILLLSITLFSISGEKMMERLSQTSIENNSRTKVYLATLNGITNNPWLGFGYGTFENTFYLYHTNISHSYDKAHNTYLENIFELGIPAACALFLSILLIALKCLTGIWRRQKNWIYPAIGFSSSVLVAAHSLVDFSLQIPAVAVTYAAVLGAGFSQAYNSNSK